MHRNFRAILVETVLTVKNPLKIKPRLSNAKKPVSL